MRARSRASTFILVGHELLLELRDAGPFPGQHLLVILVGHDLLLELLNASPVLGRRAFGSFRRTEDGHAISIFQCASQVFDVARDLFHATFFRSPCRSGRRPRKTTYLRFLVLVVRPHLLPNLAGWLGIARLGGHPTAKYYSIPED
jgi:hypothetical protein